MGIHFLKGKVKLGIVWFYPDWANPYIPNNSGYCFCIYGGYFSLPPGSDSAVFQGVSVFWVSYLHLAQLAHFLILLLV
jgi:hypothetical protein